MARQFSRKQRQAVALATGRAGDADHIFPHSAGGPTSVENCQLISASANRRKSAFVFKPRKWQTEFFEHWEERAPGAPFLLTVIPGGGKTMAALEVARRYLEAAPDRQVFIVVPTRNLCEQWKQEAVRFGIELQTREFGTGFKDGFQGAVCTYSAVASQRLVFRKRCSIAPTLVILDEVHHCGDEATFGEGVRDAFELAKEKLLMSGTPWKSDGSAIPFVNYDADGYAKADYNYGQTRAVSEEVVRFLTFDHAAASVRNDRTGDIEMLSASMSDDDAQSLLRMVLDPNGEYVRQQIALAHKRLVECRKAIPDAGALAACIDQFHARGIARAIEEVTGCKPSIIVTDDDLNNDSVERFRNGTTEWLVAVRQVSEGTDIKRLQVLCYLTNVTSELFFRQLIGRVSRVRGMEDFEAHVFLPSDPRLIRCSHNIENEQVQALRDRIEMEAREIKERDIALDLDPYSTQHHGTEVMLIGTDRVPVADARRIEAIAMQTGVSMTKVYQVLKMADVSFAAPEIPTVETSKEDRMNELRKQCNRTAFALSKAVSRNGVTVEVQEIHSHFMPQKHMTEQDLVAKLAALKSELARATTR